MSGRLFESGGVPCAERLLVRTVTVSIYDLGPSAARGERYEAELASFAVVRGSAASPWEAVRELVGGHRALLDRRWSAESPWS